MDWNKILGVDTCSKKLFDQTWTILWVPNWGVGGGKKSFHLYISKFFFFYMKKNLKDQKNIIRERKQLHDIRFENNERERLRETERT